MIFVDTSAWYAAVVPTDSNHAVATAWLTSNTVPLLTTDYVLDELLTLLRSRGHSRRAIAVGTNLIESGAVPLHLVTHQNLFDAWSIFRRFSDKEWSFTDCTSKAVMEHLSIDTAFAFDDHFRQFGTVMVVP